MCSKWSLFGILIVLLYDGDDYTGGVTVWLVSGVTGSGGGDDGNMITGTNDLKTFYTSSSGLTAKHEMSSLS